MKVNITLLTMMTWAGPRRRATTELRGGGGSAGAGVIPSEGVAMGVAFRGWEKRGLFVRPLDGCALSTRPARLAVGQGLKVPRSAAADLSPGAGTGRPVGSPAPAPGGAGLGYTRLRLRRRPPPGKRTRAGGAGGRACGPRSA